MDSARVRAELTVQGLWLRYVALGGTGDAFDVDGYLQGLIPLEIFQQDVLAQSLNEALEERYREARIPLSPPVPGESDDQLRRLAEQLLHIQSPGVHPTEDPPGKGTC